MPGCLQLLQRVAPHLEELQLQDCSRPQLQLLVAMPRLRRLELWNCADDLRKNPFVLPPLQREEENVEKQQQQTQLQQQLQQLQQQLQQHQLQDQMGQLQQLERQLQDQLQRQQLEQQRQQRLKWLRIGNLPLECTTSLIHTNRVSLEELWLLTDMPGTQQWPPSYFTKKTFKVGKKIFLMSGGPTYPNHSCTTHDVYGNTLPTIVHCQYCSNVKIEPF